ncbi:putative B3 domain-containing protein At5g66980 [Corylus avellana]|uniref:putative B3 domain-containing protein At5g66980 n=1 Tax=Corylus avellana TaxID=13451 RepID=UPI00286B89B3|nr:putative B3 domain-containing protein At5g66980 [Corylus avellana]
MVKFPFSDDSPEFFKVFLPYTSSHQMSIPQAFTMHFNGGIPKKAILFDNTKKPWHVTLEQTDGRLCFNNGWQSFASDHSLQFGNFLVFKYNRNSAFEVKIFSGKTGCKKGETVAIDHNTTPFVDLEEEDYKAEKTCKIPTSVGKRKHSEIGLMKTEEPGSSSKASGQHELPRAVETNLDEPNIPKVARLHELPRTVETKLEEQNIPEVEGFVAPKNPYVVVVAFARHMLYSVHLHQSKVKSFKIRFKKTTVIRDQNGNPWPMKVYFKGDGRIAIGSGWSNFRKKNNLHEGDQCAFDFIIGRDDLCDEIHVTILCGNA